MKVIERVLFVICYIPLLVFTAIYFFLVGRFPTDDEYSWDYNEFKKE